MAKSKRSNDWKSINARSVSVHHFVAQAEGNSYHSYSMLHCINVTYNLHYAQCFDQVFLLEPHVQLAQKQLNPS